MRQRRPKRVHADAGLVRADAGRVLADGKKKIKKNPVRADTNCVSVDGENKNFKKNSPSAQMRKKKVHPHGCYLRPCGQKKQKKNILKKIKKSVPTRTHSRFIADGKINKYFLFLFFPHLCGWNQRPRRRKKN
jgi:hypothetical protein